MKRTLYYIFFSLLILGIACKKDRFTSSADAKLTLSQDSLHFDTVFTSAGSVTQQFKITNANNQRLRISNIALQGGIASAFKINVDGTPGPAVSNIELDANDSLFVFVTVVVPASQASRPFIYRDSILVESNGNKNYMRLEAWGQNAHFLRNKKLTGNNVWVNDLPYVILGGLQIDTNASLSIEKGCRVYLHADAPLLVDGSLAVNGEKNEEDRVYFSGDRLDYPYNEYPAAWPGIYFRGSSNNNRFQYAVVRNAYQGLVVQQPSVNANPKLTLEQCIVDNIYDVGLYGIGSSVQASNCLFSNCGKNVQLVYGGNYQLLHCTLASISNNYITHKDPVLFISDYVQSGSSIFTANLNAAFTNCIIWAENGTAENEVVTAKQGTGSYSINFTNCLWKLKTAPQNSTIANVIANQPPLFDSINVTKNIYNFRLKDGSPALNAGIASGLLTDLDGKPRPVGLPDLGAYERQ
ncbi:MAG TPA: choice-of-anchor Q domain-containing protein [Chitinophagaceae bacterium]|nr:choice-of-anchor Q domain-containing protein [Chitinophagaceae bacterium]